MVLFHSGISIETGRPARCGEAARGVTLFSPVSRSVKGLNNLDKKVVRPQRIFNAGSHLCAIIITLITWNIQVFLMSINRMFPFVFHGIYAIMYEVTVIPLFRIIW